MIGWHIQELGALGLLYTRWGIMEGDYRPIFQTDPREQPA